MKHLCVIVDDNIISNVRFEKVFTTNEESNIINKFDYKIYLEQNISLNKNSNFSSINNNNQDKIPIEKNEKNSSIFNNEIQINASNNDYAFIKNNNSFPYGVSNNTAKMNSKKKINLKEFNNINNSLPNFEFFKIYIKKLKIVILKKSDVIIISFFSCSTKTCLIKNYLLHMYVVYSNFFFDSFETAKIKYSEGISILTKNLQNANKKKSRDITYNNNNTAGNLNNGQSKYALTQQSYSNNVVNTLSSNIEKKNSALLDNNKNNINNNNNNHMEISDSKKSSFVNYMKNIFFEVKFLNL